MSEYTVAAAAVAFFALGSFVYLSTELVTLLFGAERLPTLLRRVHLARSDERRPVRLVQTSIALVFFTAAFLFVLFGSPNMFRTGIDRLLLYGSLLLSASWLVILVAMTARSRSR